VRGAETPLPFFIRWTVDVDMKKEFTEVCVGCKDTRLIKENPIDRRDWPFELGAWKTCRFCGKIRWCLLYLI